MLRDCTTCGNCTWGNGLGPFPEICIKCRYVEEDGSKVLSNWKAKPKTNADRIRAWNDHELAETIANFVSEIDNGDVRYSDDPNEWLEWLQRPAEGE